MSVKVELVKILTTFNKWDIRGILLIHIILGTWDLELDKFTEIQGRREVMEAGLVF